MYGLSIVQKITARRVRVRRMDMIQNIEKSGTIAFTTLKFCYSRILESIPSRFRTTSQLRQRLSAVERSIVSWMSSLR